MMQKSSSELVKIAEQVRALVLAKCEEIEKEVVTYKSFQLERRPDGNLAGLLEKAADLRKAQDRVSSIRLDILSLQRTAREKIKKYKEILKSAESEARVEVDKANTGRRVSKALKEDQVRGIVSEYNRLVVDLEATYDRTNLTIDIVKEIDSNLRDGAIQLSNQINVINNMVRIGEVKAAPIKPIMTGDGHVPL